MTDDELNRAIEAAAAVEIKDYAHQLRPGGALGILMELLTNQPEFSGPPRFLTNGRAYTSWRSNLVLLHICEVARAAGSAAALAWFR
ncbi:MAG TPA: hypothetical protein VGR92_23770, partial [Steroidobacteraceae bacterium]|nr:hypothetical protein [Steroidobacteraceae bacterium]